MEDAFFIVQDTGEVNQILQGTPPPGDIGTGARAVGSCWWHQWASTGMHMKHSYQGLRGGPASCIDTEMTKSLGKGIYKSP